MSVRDIDRDAARRLRLPDGMSGALVARVDPLSAAWDAGIQRDYVVLEINRRPVDIGRRLQPAGARGASRRRPGRLRVPARSGSAGHSRSFGWTRP